MHASMQGRKRREVAFFIPSINLASAHHRVSISSFLAFAAPSTMVSIDAKSYFTIWLHIVDALKRTTWLKRRCFCHAEGRGGWPHGLLTCGPTCQWCTKPIRIPHHYMRQNNGRSNFSEEWNDGCFIPPTYTVGKLQLCDLMPHCFVICDSRRE